MPKKSLNLEILYNIILLINNFKEHMVHEFFL